MSTTRRSRRSRLRRWFLLTGSRLSVTAVILGVVYLLLHPLAHLATTGVEQPLRSVHTVETLLSTLLSGVFLVVSIVVSINSLFVSQEQTPLGRQFDRIHEVGEFRRELESLVDEPVSPAEPTRFLRLLTRNVLSGVQAVADDVEEWEDAAADLDRLLDYTAGETRLLDDRLGEADTPLDVVVATMDYDHGRLSHELRRLRTVHGDDLADETTDRVEAVLDLMEYFVTAREYFKTLYLGREFAALSNRLLYVSFPAVVSLVFVLGHLNDVPDAHWMLVLVQVIALAPFALLAAYVVRVGTVTKRTRAAGGFVVDPTGNEPPREDEPRVGTAADGEPDEAPDAGAGNDAEDDKHDDRTGDKHDDRTGGETG